MSILDNPNDWFDWNYDSPPMWWEATGEADGKFWFTEDHYGALPEQAANYFKGAALPSTLLFNWEITAATEGEAGPFELEYTFDWDGDVWTTVELGNTVSSGAETVTIPDGSNPNLFAWRIPYNGGGSFSGALSIQGEGDNFNCACDEDESPNETLSTLRTRLLRRLGYSAQAASPPPGMAALLDDFLYSAQKFLYTKYKDLRTERFFTWTMEVGGRFYDLDANDGSCTKRLNALKVTSAHVEDLNGAWLPMVAGIPPYFYTMVAYNGIPSRYEIRQCIEVFPAPAEGYKLHLKGHFLPTAFTADTDKTTIDSELVFLWALANAKLHYGQPDADKIAQQANTYLATLVGGSHTTQRYIPNTSPIPNTPAPLFLPLVP